MKISLKESNQLRKFTKWFWNKILYFKISEESYYEIFMFHTFIIMFHFSPGLLRFYFRSKSEKLSSIRIGDLLTATVKEITDMGAILGKQRLIYFSGCLYSFLVFNSTAVNYCIVSGSIGSATWSGSAKNIH